MDQVGKDKGALESHFSGVVVAKLSGDMVSVLAFTYGMAGRQEQMRVPGGGGRFGENPKETATRELRDEVSEETAPFDLKEGHLSEVFRRSIPGDPRQGGGTHHKIFYAVDADELVCTFRRKSITEPDGVKLGQPSWHEAGALARKMFEDGTPKYHILAVLKVIETIASADEKVAGRYAGLLADYREFMNRA